MTGKIPMTEEVAVEGAATTGRAVEASVDARTHLADFLRDGLHLTGTHLGCEHGVCEIGRAHV